MKIPVKFIWGSPRAVIGRWYGGLFCIYERPVETRERPSGPAQGAGVKTRRRVAVSVRGLVLWGMVLMIAAYFSTAFIVYKWWESRPFNLVTLEDCVLYPARRGVIKEKQGRAFIADGLSDIKAGRVRQGMQKLSTGLRRYPQETTGRLVLAKIYVLINARQKSVMLLREGLSFASTDRPYMESLLRFAAEGEDFDLWLEACDTALARSADRPDLAAFRRWITQSKITALTASGASAAAVRLAETSGADTVEEFAELKALALLKNGQAGDAVAFIGTWRGRKGQGNTLVPLQIRALREAGRREDMERALAAWCQRDSLDPAPYIALVVNRALLHDKAGAQAAMDTFFSRFGSYPENVLKLSEALVPLGESALSGQCLANAQAQGFQTFTLRQFLMETCLTAGEWSAAQAQLAELKPLLPKKNAMALYWDMAGLLVDATIDPAEGVQSALVSYLQDQHLSLLAYDRLLNVLRTCGRTATALDMVRVAQGQFPNSPSLKKADVNLTAQLAALQAAKPKPTVVVVKTNPAADAQIQAAAREIMEEMEDEPRFFKKLDEQVKSGKPDEALASIRAVREARPAWFGERSDELALLEVRLYAAQNDTFTMRGLARIYLNGDAGRSQKMLSLAKEIRAGGDPAAAVLLAQEILRKAPAFSPAKKLLDEWSAPPPKSAPAKEPAAAASAP